MIKNATKIWGFKEPQSESSFDPVVSLLLGACAFELEKISREINNTESRIIERLVNILTPQPITSPHPAYAVAYAKPTRKGTKILPEFQFFTNIRQSDQSANNVEEKEIYFSPAGTYALTYGQVRYLAAHKRVYEIVDEQYKDVIVEMYGKSLSPSSLFIGLELEDNPADISLFFDVVSDHLKQNFFSDLDTCQWKVGNDYVKTYKGITDLGRRKNDVYQLINREIDLSSKISNHVNRYFKRQFVTLKLNENENFTSQEITRIPDSLEASIKEKDRPNIEENITWIELQFNAPLPDELIENLNCSLNCFPIINRKKNEFTGSTRELINIIPLHTEDVFFDLKSVSNSNGEFYKIKHFEGTGDLVGGTALLRLDGVGRFDARNAMEFLEYLLELLKEESAAFNVIGSDMITSNLRELNQAIARLEKKIEDVQLEKGDTAYLMLKPQDDDRQVYVEFWSTNCSYANNIRAGNTLNIYEAMDLDYNATRLMTSTTGGREKPSTEDRINTYRRSLLSGNRVVTKEDVKALCYEHFGESISGVRVEKGIARGSLKSEGFVRATDIYITLAKSLETNLALQNDMKHKLLVLLEEKSSNVFPFRVFFEKQAI